MQRQFAGQQLKHAAVIISGLLIRRLAKVHGLVGELDLANRIVGSEAHRLFEEKLGRVAQVSCESFGRDGSGGQRGRGHRGQRPPECDAEAPTEKLRRDRRRRDHRLNLLQGEVGAGGDVESVRVPVPVPVPAPGTVPVGNPPPRYTVLSCSTGEELHPYQIWSVSRKEGAQCAVAYARYTCWRSHVPRSL